MKLDKVSQKKLVQSTAEIIQNSGVGNNVETRIIVSPRRLKLPENIMVFQAFAFLAATKLSYNAMKILMLFFSKSGYENFVGMDIKTIMEDLKYKSETTVINGLNQLVKNNIIIKTTYVTDRRRNEYFINPIVAWKGNSFSRKKSVKTLQENKNQLDIFGNTPAQMEKATQEKHSLLSISKKTTK